MKIRKLLAAALAVMMVLAAVPVLSLAEGTAAIAGEANAMRKLDTTWAALERAEQEAIASGKDRNQVINAVYQAAINLPNVDKAGFSDFTADGFFFTVDGMYCSYNFRLRNELDTNVAPVPETEKVVLVKGSGAASKDAESPNVFLVAPYYGHDGSFTNQYKEEAQSIAEATGGDYLLIQSTAATGPAIAENYTDKGVVIYDSHGTQSGTSSYLCLTTNSGITQQDYNNGWAVNAGSAAYIDGRYIENHANGTLSNCIVWMAICEGMKRQGQGTTGYALLRAGAGVVYGYSQNVTFRGDYEYEAEFWTHMKDGETVAEAYDAMVARYGVPDPYGDAYPIVMSPDDPFPSNPDAAQVVNCDWILYGNAEPVELVNFSLDKDSVQIYLGMSEQVNFLRVPDNANQYELAWSSANNSVATVTGNNRKGTINGMGIGATTVTCTVNNANGQLVGTATVEVDVVEDTSLRDALNVEGGTIAFSSAGNYPFFAEQGDGRFYVRSGNAGQNSSASALTTVIEMEAGETLVFDYKNSSETNYDFFNFIVNDQQILHLSGTNNSNWTTYTYTAASAGTYTFKWEFTKDVSVNGGDDCVKIDNVVYSGDPGPAAPSEPGDGDVDGNGIVAVSDALIAMRIAMGTLDGTAEQIARGDLDGDGIINMAEALQIMRIAMMD
ncbi:MAG: Ig-like domain-containing protein [Clostridia bacterium]|nr:Ig-like domain-containing protein [Clostridia bacterium]